MNQISNINDTRAAASSNTTVECHAGGRATTGFRPRGSSSTQAPAAHRRTRRSRVLGGLAGAAILAVAATGCFPTGPVETWVPDFDGDGHVTQVEVDRHKQDVVNQVLAAIEQQRRAVQRHPFLSCVRHHESDRGAFPHDDGYGAQNPRSSASGAYQFLDSTWRNVAARSGHGGYARASHAPWYVQDAVALWVFNNGGKSAWNGTGC